MNDERRGPPRWGREGIVVEMDSGQNDIGTREPPSVVEIADDPDVGAGGEGELGRRSAPDVRAEKMVDRPLTGSSQDQELDRFRNQCQTEVEVKDVGSRQERRLSQKLDGLPSNEPRRSIKRDVCLGVQS